MATQKFKIRQLHRTIAPIMLLPILMTLITGSVFQVLDKQGKGEEFDWLLDVHKGHFGSLNLESVYPYLNALGLLVLAITGISMWAQLRRTRSSV